MINFIHQQEETDKKGKTKNRHRHTHTDIHTDKEVIKYTEWTTQNNIGNYTTNKTVLLNVSSRFWRQAEHI